MSLEICPVCGAEMEQRPDMYYECQGCGTVMSQNQLNSLRSLV